MAFAIAWNREDKDVSPPGEIDIKHDCMPEPHREG